MESSEETPLLSSDRDVLVDREEVYKRFAPARKRGILAIVALTGLVPRTCIITNAAYINLANSNLLMV